MFSRPSTSRDVWRYTFFTGLFSVVVTVVMVPLSFDLPDLWPILIKSAGIALCCSIPVGWFLANEMRKNENLNRTLRDLVNRDRLTDVATRDYFFDQMEANPESYGVSLMVDIDHFKTVNDKFGHLAGDQVIRQVAAVLRNTVREEDIVCRFGGEEFIIFLAEYQHEEGIVVAERIRHSIEMEVIRLQELAISVTVSIGGSLKDRITDINKAIKASDDALYQAKAAGRNQIVFDDPPTL